MIASILLSLLALVLLFEAVTELRADRQVSLWRIVAVFLVLFLLYAHNDDYFAVKVTKPLGGKLPMIVVVLGLLLFGVFRASGTKLIFSARRSRRKPGEEA